MRELRVTNETPTGDDAYYLYNGLDCSITIEVWNKIRAQASNSALSTYEFSRAVQAPALEMMLRGFRVDMIRRNQMIEEMEKALTHLRANFDKLCTALYDNTINANSPAQLQAFFYEFLRITPRMKDGRPTTNREALEAIQAHFIAEPFVRHILSIRDLVKRISTLRTSVDHDLRMRTGYNVAGTETGRFSSFRSAFDTGTNLQNITERLRRVFVADNGYKLAYIDKEQAESRAVGLYAWAATGIDTYLKACESGDLHTIVASMVWPNLSTEEIKENKYYRDFTYRDIAKRLGHASNYGGLPSTLSRILKIPEDLVRSFQRAYFSAFREIILWHAWVSRQLVTSGTLTTAFGRTRQFLGRANDDSTLREAIAYLPQSHVAEDLNLAMLTVWRANLPIQLIAQIHDAILFQFPETDEATILPAVTSRMLTPVSLTSTYGTRSLSIPVDCQVGWNWAHQDAKRKLFSDGNPDGLTKWRGKDERARTEFVDRRFHGMEQLHV